MYWFFPRSVSPESNKHGIFADCKKLLPRVVGIGFDNLYFPAIHPICEINLKGVNNATVANPGDIGSEHGGHKDTHLAWHHCRIC